MHVKKTTIALFLSCAAGLMPAAAFAKGASETASQGGMSVAASPLLSVTGHPLQGSVAGAFGSGLIVVSLVEGSADTFRVVLEKAADGSKATVAMSASAVRAAGLSVGKTVNVVSEATGHSLVYMGKLLAFIPNTAGEALLHRSRVDQEAAPALQP